MNCKPGDIAIVVKSFAGNEGKIVRCIRLIGKVVWFGPNMERIEDWTWEIDTYLAGCFGEPGNTIEDQLLRPIRPDETPEESTEAMRLLTQLPQKEKV